MVEGTIQSEMANKARRIEPERILTLQLHFFLPLSVPELLRYPRSERNLRFLGLHYRLQNCVQHLAHQIDGRAWRLLAPAI